MTQKGLSYNSVRKIALALPGVEDGTSYGTPALKVCGKLLIRLREDGETIALRIGLIERQELLDTDPNTFFVTDHYLNYPMVLVRLSEVLPKRLSKLIGASWHELAPKRLLTTPARGVKKPSRKVR